MKPRWIVLLLTASVLLVSAGFALGDARPGSVQGSQPHRMGASSDDMHDSTGMKAMLRRASPELAEQCEAMHGRMLPMMGDAGMMSDAGMMGDA